jgi:hypothetical protein
VLEVTQRSAGNGYVVIKIALTVTEDNLCTLFAESIFCSHTSLLRMHVKYRVTQFPYT